MDGPTNDVREAIAALLHRLASPVGALRNYVHVIPDAPKDIRAGMREASDAAGLVIDEGRSWVRALATLTDPPAPDGVDLDEALEDAKDSLKGDITLTADALPRVHGPIAAVRRILRGVLDEALSAGGEAANLRVTATPGDPVELRLVQPDRAAAETSEPAAFDLFTRRDPGSNARQYELAVAAALARQLGGRVWGGATEEGEAVVHVALPGVAPDASHGEPTPQ